MPPDLCHLCDDCDHLLFDYGHDAPSDSETLQTLRTVYDLVTDATCEHQPGRTSTAPPRPQPPDPAPTRRKLYDPNDPRSLTERGRDTTAGGPAWA